ncbi:hypothetical protein [Ruegeria arenilitoris]|nr:hypothetical protein [Ruegeria arenilitoris]
MSQREFSSQTQKADFSGARAGDQFGKNQLLQKNFKTPLDDVGA